MLPIAAEVLDYFEGVSALLGDTPAARERSTVFRYETDMKFGLADRRLLGQLLHEVGYPAHGFPEFEGQPEEAGVLERPQPWRYLTGEAAEVIKDYPELEALRDITFLLKAFMAPERADLPALATYHVTEAILSWSSDKHGELKVQGFRRSLQGAYTARKRSVLSSAVAWVKGGSTARVSRSKVEPSGERIEHL
jgi:hypothetical protein